MYHWESLLCQCGLIVYIIAVNEHCDHWPNQNNHSTIYLWIKSINSNTPIRNHGPITHRRQCGYKGTIVVIVPWISAKPFIGTLEVPVTNCNRRALFSLSMFSTAYMWEKGNIWYTRMERRERERERERGRRRERERGREDVTVYIPSKTIRWLGLELYIHYDI